MFKLGVFAVILDEKQRVLLCHRRDYDFWNLPGGKLEKGESPWSGVIREVKEETSLKVKIDKLAGIYSKPQKNEMIFCFKCKVIGGKIALSDETDKIEYFEFKNLPKNTPPKQVERIKDALEGKDKLILKTQRGPSSIELVKQGKL